MSPSPLRTVAEKSNAWPFVEARSILKQLGGKDPKKGCVLFETGYGPSGLPHIGTFSEVARTSMVRHAFECLSDIPTKLYAFSDDMDGLRKIPDNIPHQEMMTSHLHKALTNIPDPFGTHDSFGAHNNARLCAFLDSFGFDYEFKSATELYTSGAFDAALMRVLEHYDAIMEIMLPSLREERRHTYSPFMPVCPETGHVLQVPIIERDVSAGTVVYQDASGQLRETPVTGGRCKLQWKPDWAMRWYALAVDYEMSGKDLIDSKSLGREICRTLGGVPPTGFSYELFLDDRGEKISKSRGNGLSIDQWLRYAPPESLSLFMFQKPKTAKRLYFDVIPKAVDEYAQFMQGFPKQDDKSRLDNPVWHIHKGQPPTLNAPLSFNMVLNLVGVCHTEDKSALWHFITRYRPDLTPETSSYSDSLVGYAIAYYRDFIAPHRVYRAPTSLEREAILQLRSGLENVATDTQGADIQNIIYEIGKAIVQEDGEIKSLRDWFRTLYEVLLGQSDGPRMGSFVALYGIAETIALIDERLS